MPPTTQFISLSAALRSGLIDEQGNPTREFRLLLQGYDNKLAKTLDLLGRLSQPSFDLSSAPLAPPTGEAVMWADQADGNIKVKNAGGTVSVTVQPAAQSGSNFITGVASNGAPIVRRPQFPDVSGVAAPVQLALVNPGDIPVVAGGVLARLSVGGAGTVLKGGAAPSYAAVATTDVGGNLHGNGGSFQASDGTGISGHFASFDLNGNLTDSGLASAGLVTTGVTLTLGQILVGAGGSAVGVGNLSGDASTAGGTAVTVTGINGAAFPLSATVLGSNASSQPIAASLTGSGAVVLASSPGLTTPAITTSLNPASAGGATLGTAALPFSSAFIGSAATNNTQITGTVTGARVFTLPDANSNPVQPSTAGANQFATAISSAGVISYAQPAFSNLSGTIVIGQTPLTTLGDLLYVNVTPGLARLAGNITTAKQFLSQTGTGTVSAVPAWVQPAAADLSNGVTGSGAVALASSPVLTTPNIGAATFTSLTSATANAAAAGAIRLANGDLLAFRNAANLADVTFGMTTDSSSNNIFTTAVACRLGSGASGFSIGADAGKIRMDAAGAVGSEFRCANASNALTGMTLAGTLLAAAATLSSTLTCNGGAVFNSTANKLGQNAMVAASGAINTTETVIVHSTAAIGANRIVAGTTIRAVLIGTCTSTVANASTFAIRIGTAGTVADGVVFSAATAAAATAGTAVPFRAVLEMTVRTNGATATAFGTLTLFNQGITGIATTAVQVINATMSTFSTANSNFINITYVSAATTTTSTFQQAWIEVLYD